MTALEDVRKYYGETLKTSADLRTGACCPLDAMPAHVREIVAQIHPEVQQKFYGCGSPIPVALEGCTVLDLGCGTGRDSFVISRLVGESGRVIGVDMTHEQLAVARRHADHHHRQFGFEKANTEFRKGYIEDLGDLGIEDDSIDVVVSNCVLNLSPDKPRVFKEIFRVLKPGGELYFSDIFANRRIPQALRADPVLRGECLGGAMYTEDFRRLLGELGINDYRMMSSSPVPIEDEEINAKIGMVDFLSATIRAFKLPLEDRCEDYGQVAWYLGGIDESPHRFVLDDHHLFEVGKPMLVCSNTARMLSRTRLSRWFRIEGDEQTHFGLFDCNTSATASDEEAGGCC